MTRLVLGSSLALALVASAPAASAQSTPALEPRRAGILNLGTSIGILGGAYPHGHLEYQQHFGPRFQGHMLGVGAGATYRPDLGGVSITGLARYQYDYRLVNGANVFISPYVGLELGVAIVENKMDLAGWRVAATPNAGVELKFVLDRLYLAFRPFGLHVPLIIGERQSSGLPIQWDMLWDIALSIGFTF
jgi:hypothetical protein